MVKAEVNESLHRRRLDINALAAFLANERFDDGQAAKHVGRSAMRTSGAAYFRACEFHQSLAGAVDGNCIDHSAARITDNNGDIATFLDHEAAVAIRAGGKFVRQDEIPAFVLGHIG